jgi:hypothetical protein
VDDCPRRSLTTGSIRRFHGAERRLPVRQSSPDALDVRLHPRPIRLMQRLEPSPLGSSFYSLAPRGRRSAALVPYGRPGSPEQET